MGSVFGYLPLVFLVLAIASAIDFILGFLVFILVLIMVPLFLYSFYKARNEAIEEFRRNNLSNYRKR